MPNTVQLELTARDAAMQAALQRVAGAAEAIKSKLESVGNAAKGILLGGITGAAIKTAMGMEASALKFNAALTANGVSVDQWGGKLNAAAKAIASVTDETAGSVKQAMTFGVNMGVTAEKLDETTRAAKGLATATNESLETAMRQLLLAQQGEFGMLERQIPALRAAATAQEKMAIVNRMAKSGWDQAKAAGEGADVQLGKMWKSLQGLQGTIAQAVVPLIKQLTTHIRAITGVVSEWAKANQDNIAKVVGTTAAVLGAIAVVPKLIALFKGVAATATALAGGPLGMIVVGLAGVAGVLAYAAGEGDTFTARMVSGLKTVGVELDAMLGSWEGAKETLTNLWDATCNTISANWNELTRALQGYWSMFSTWIQEQWVSLKEFFYKYVVDPISRGWAKLTGKDMVEAERTIESQQRERMLRYSNDRINLQSDMVDRLKAIDQAYQDRQVQIGNKDLERQREHAKKIADLPKASDKLAGGVGDALRAMGLTGLVDQYNALMSKFKADQDAAGGGPGDLALLGGAGKGSAGAGGSGKAGGFEDLTALYKRIATAAGGGSPEARTADATERTARATERIATKVESGWQPAEYKGNPAIANTGWNIFAKPTAVFGQ